jgi:hypothetical protein
VSGSGPILIGGLSHSGKTEVRTVLGAHPELSLTRRTYLWDRFYGRFGDLTRSRNLERCLEAMLRSDGVATLQPDPASIREELAAGPATYARLFGIFHRQHAERSGKRRWGEQLGFVERYADPVFATFPDARMIHLIRDPRARYASGSDARRRRGSVGWETARWLRSVDLAERNERRHPRRYRVVRYETLAARPEETMRELCDFVGEPFLDVMADALLRTALHLGDDDAPAAATARSSADLAFVELAAARQLTGLGYPPAGIRMPARRRLSFLLVDRPLNRTAMAAWRVLGDGRVPAGQEG